MKGFLLDTNVLSELRRPQCSASVEKFASSQPSSWLFTSVINIAEIRFGRNQAPTAEKQRLIDDWLAQDLRPWFQGRLLPANEDTFVIWRDIVESGRVRNYTFPEPDTLIAAIAKQNEMVMVTRDIRPFAEAGIPVLDPWVARFIQANGQIHASMPLDNTNHLQILTAAKPQ